MRMDRKRSRVKINVPVWVRDKLDLRPGDRLVWKIEKDGVCVSRLMEGGE